MRKFAVGDLQVRQLAADVTEVSADLGGERCWFRIPADRAVPWRGDAWAVASLLPAMAKGLPLVIDSAMPVCPVLLANLEQLQRMFRLWGPALGVNFQPIPIEATTAPAPPGNQVGSFFSGGVDGTYTFLEAPTPPQVAVFVEGVDFQLGNPIYRESLERNRVWVEARGAAMLPMASNLRWVGRAHGVRWGAFFGAGLAAFSHALGLKQTWIAGGLSWKDLVPEGSHPCSDPLWSTASNDIRHHGRDALRWEKLERISQSEGALDILRVCWQDRGFNCGQCEKCIRTMVLLRLLGLTSPNFPALPSSGLVRRLIPGDQIEAIFVAEALDLAAARGDRHLEAGLAQALRRWRMRSLASAVDRDLLGGMFRGLRSKIRGGSGTA